MENEYLTEERRKHILDGIFFLSSRYRWPTEEEWTTIAIKALEQYLKDNSEH